MMELGVAKEVTATGDIAGAEGVQATLRGCTLTGGSDAATATIREGGSGGTVVLVLKVAAATTIVVPIPFAIRRPHVTLAGTGPSFTAFL